MEPLYLYLYLPLLIIVLHALTGRLLNRLHKLPPAPFPALPLVGHLYMLDRPFHKSLSKLSAKYGPVLSLQLGRVPVVVVSSPLTAQDCFAKNDVIFANRPEFLTGKYFGYNWTSLIWSSYGEHWRNLRRISSIELLSGNMIQILSEIRAGEVRSLVRKLFRGSVEDPTRLVDLRGALFDLTFNVMAKMITGKRYYGENVTDLQEAKAFKDLISELGKLNVKAIILDFLPFMRWIRKGYKDLEEKMEDVQMRRDKFMQNVIDEHRKMKTDDDRDSESGMKKKTMIRVLLDLHEDEPEYYSDETIKSLMLVLFQAGSDTTATTMEWAMAHLINNPDVLKKAHTEIESVMGYKRFLVESDLPALPYLRCIINETLRLHPSAPLLLPHKASQDCIVGGYRIPTGSVLFVNVWDLHRNPKNWSDPDTFRPERFEGWEVDGSEKEELKKKFMPFGSGRRGCPGENLGMVVLGLALGLLIQCFDWKTEGDVDLSDSGGTPVYMIHPLAAKCSYRPNMLKLLSHL